MKNLFLILGLVLSSVYAVAKGHSGSGGDPCSESFYNIVSEVFTSIEAKKIRLPKSLSLDDLIDTYSNLTITPVNNMSECTGAPDYNQSTRTACAYVNNNEVVLECSPENDMSWLNIVSEKPKLARELVLHELFWWHESVNDSKMYYSKRLTKQLPVKWKTSWLHQDTQINAIEANVTTFSNVLITLGDYTREKPSHQIFRNLSNSQKSANNFCRKLNYDNAKVTDVKRKNEFRAVTIDKNALFGFSSNDWAINSVICRL